MIRVANINLELVENANEIYWNEMHQNYHEHPEGSRKHPFSSAKPNVNNRLGIL